MEKTTQDLVDRVKSITEKDANDIIKEMRKINIPNSVSLENFVADYLNAGRYCIVNNDEGKECVPCQHREVLINFLINLDTLFSEARNLLNKVSDKIISTRTVRADVNRK